MPFNNFIPGLGPTNNPLVNTPFYQSWTGQGINPPPVGHDLRITNAGDNRTTNADELRITNTE